MLSSSQLGQLHGRLVRILQRRAQTEARPLKIEGPENWPKRPNASRVEFYLSNDGPVDKAERNLGGRCPVYRLPDYDPLRGAVWFSWHEVWQKIQKNEFDLVSASFTFFWGPVDRQRQVLRAEWDTARLFGGNAAQPHWHIDAEYLLDIPSPPNAGSAPNADGMPESELEELATETRDPEAIPPERYLQVIDIHGLHLGMGGWDNGEALPGCWQLAAADVDTLTLWAERTLEYTASQFKRMKLVETST